MRRLPFPDRQWTQHGRITAVNDSEDPSGKQRFARQLLQYLAPAAVTAAAMIAFAVLPRQFGGLPFTAAWSYSHFLTSFPAESHSLLRARADGASLI